MEFKILTITKFSLPFITLGLTSIASAECHWDWYQDASGNWQQQQFCDSSTEIAPPSIAPIEISPVCITTSQYMCTEDGCGYYQVCQ